MRHRASEKLAFRDLGAIALYARDGAALLLFYRLKYRFKVSINLFSGDIYLGG